MDTGLFFLINRGMANPLFDVVMPALTYQGYLMAVPLLFYAVYRGASVLNATGRTYLAAAIAAVVLSCCAVPLADTASGWIKEVVARPRPCRTLDGVRLVIACPRSFSFPSSHAATSFAFITPFLLLTRRFLARRWLVFLFLLASAIAFSRPYLGVHYPSDILAGAVLGAGIAGGLCGIYWMFRKAARSVLAGEGKKG